jgi:membrane-associated protein
MLASLHFILDPQTIVRTLGAVGVIAIVFAETGLFIGFFLPGDSLLFTAGFLASQGYISLAGLLFGAFIAAVIGDSVGYAFGHKVGPAIFVREDSFFFDRRHIARAQHFYETHGKKTIILARFIPAIRAFAPVVAGVGAMNYRTFLPFNIIGGFLWTWSMLILGYALGAVIPNPDRYVLPIVILIILISLLPVLREILRKRQA